MSCASSSSRPMPGPLGLLRLQPGVLDGDRGLVGDADQDAHPARAEHVRAVDVVGQQRADQARRRRAAARPGSCGCRNARARPRAPAGCPACRRRPAAARCGRRRRAAADRRGGSPRPRTRPTARAGAPCTVRARKLPSSSIRSATQRSTPVSAGAMRATCSSVTSTGCNRRICLGHLQQDRGGPRLFLAHGGQPGVVDRRSNLVGDAAQHGEPPLVELAARSRPNPTPSTPKTSPLFSIGSSATRSPEQSR